MTSGVILHQYNQVLPAGFILEVILKQQVDKYSRTSITCPAINIISGLSEQVSCPPIFCVHSLSIVAPVCNPTLRVIGLQQVCELDMVRLR